MNAISRDNFRSLLSAFIDKEAVRPRKTAARIGCSEATFCRVLSGETLPSDKMLKQGAIMFELGFKRFSKLSKAEREKISEALGTVGGGTLGFASITATVSTLGTVTGLSAAGISSGLTALGGLVSGGMAAGVAVAAAIPVAAAGSGYGIIKGVKALIRRHKLNKKGFDPVWEFSPIKKMLP